MQAAKLFEELVFTEANIRGLDALKNHGFIQNGEFYNIRDADAGGDRKEIAGKLYENFLRLYEYQLQDSSQHHEDANIRGMKAADSVALSVALSAAMRRFVDALYDESGVFQPQDAEKAANAIHALLESVQKLKLRHAAEVVGALTVELSRGDKWQQSGIVPPGGLDYTRGEPTDDVVRHIRDAFDPAKDHTPPTSEFIHPPESVEVIGGLRFPYYMIEGRKHLITPSGHLVDLTTEPGGLKERLEQHIASGKPLQEFTVQPHEDVHLVAHKNWGNGNGKELCHLDVKDTKNLAVRHVGEMSDAKVVDCERVRDENNTLLPQPLLSIDIDLLTGLRMTPYEQDGASDLQRVQAFAKKHGIGKWIDLLPDVSAGMVKLIAAADKEQPELVPLLEFAKNRLEKTMPRIVEVAEGHFTGKSRVDDKKMYLTQGGPGCGKGSLENIVKDECGDNFVVASLDEARHFSDQIYLYMATDNHNHDYLSISEFGNAIRDLVTKKAIDGDYNILIDGSGIPYEGRNDKIVNEFNDRGYETSLMGVHIPLYVYNPELRKKLDAKSPRQAPDDAFLRMGERQDSRLRALPIEPVKNKHIDYAIASLNAARGEVHRYFVQDTYGDKPHTLSFVIPHMSKTTLKAIEKLEGDELLQALIAHDKNNDHALIPHGINMPLNNDPNSIADLKVIKDNGDDTYRVEVITDLQRHVNKMQTGLLNRNPRGPESLYDNRVVCDIMGHFQGHDGVLRHQPVRKINIKTYPGQGRDVTEKPVLGPHTNGVSKATPLGSALDLR